MNNSRKIAFQRIVDSHFGKPFYLPFLLIRRIDKRKFPEKIKNVAIFRLSSIGDSVLLLPAIKNLKEKTGARITVICAKENFPVFEGQRFIDKIIILDNKILSPVEALRAIIKVRKEKPGLVIDTTHSSNLSSFFSYFVGAYTIGFSNPVTKIKNKMYDKSLELNIRKHMTLNYFDLFGLAGVGYNSEINLVNLFFSEGDYNKINAIVGNRKKLVVIHLTSWPEYKKWPMESIVKLTDYLCSKKYSIVLTGSENEQRISKDLLKSLKKSVKKNVFDLCGKTSTKELFALMSKASLFVGNDGGPMHIASAMKVPIIGIFTKMPNDPAAGLFGAEDKFRYYPFSKRSGIIYRENIKDLKFSEIKSVLNKTIKIK